MSNMICHNILSLIIAMLRLIKIIPNGKSRILDRVGLFFWTILSLSLSISFLHVEYSWIVRKVSESSVYALFDMGSSTFVPAVQITTTLPAVFFLSVTYPYLQQRVPRRSDDDGTSPPVLSLPQAWLFLVDILLGTSSFGFAFMEECTEDHCLKDDYVGFVANTMYFFGMNISTFVVAVTVGRMETRLANAGAYDDGQFSLLAAPGLLREMRELKAGLSPLLFQTFSTKCIIIINFLVSLLSSPTWNGLTTLAFTLVDLLFTSVIISNTFDAFKTYALGLR